MFEGKVVLVYLIDPSEEFASGISISNPEVKDHYGRKFIYGTVPENSDDWASGLKVSVAFDQIAHFLEFSDEREFFDRNNFAIPRIQGKAVQ
ncbi:MAG: hypothetical protein C4583_05735 [Anaerolineaceae bacterium]|jgi:hypothetical protein|nr:MAG: hypothetical protein C4583_05735 [Anaerolineaceae bacterium]